MDKTLSHEGTVTCYLLEYSTSVKLLTEHHMEFLSLKGGCTGSSESTRVKMPHCWKSHVADQLCLEEFTKILKRCHFCCAIGLKLVWELEHLCYIS